MLRRMRERARASLALGAEFARQHSSLEWMTRCESECVTD